MTDTIRRTQLPGVEIVTVRSADPNLARPFQTYAVTAGVVGHITHHVTKAAAMHFHDVLVAAEMGRTGEGRSMPPSASVRDRERKGRSR